MKLINLLGFQFLLSIYKFPSISNMYFLTKNHFQIYLTITFFLQRLQDIHSNLTMKKCFSEKKKLFISLQWTFFDLFFNGGGDLGKVRGHQQ